MSASFSIVIEGKGTFTASIADPEASVTVGTNTPASFTAEVAPVGPAGATGATGPAGVVAATAPITYNSGTQTVAMDTAYFVRSPATAATDGQIISWDDATARSVWIDNAARTLFSTVRNETGATLVAGTVVYISGASGNKALVTKAQANTEASSSRTFAVIATAISNNQNGTAIVAGELGKLNTTAYAEGATLYLSPTTAGTFTTTKPTAPNHIVYIGTVTRVHANQGTIEVRIQNGSELDEMADVLLTSKANNDLLVYETSSSLWKNKSFSTLDLLTATTAASTYQTQAGMSSYYLASNPSGYITSSALSGYATESWVTSQGYLTAPYNPFNQTLNTSSTVLFTSSHATNNGSAFPISSIMGAWLFSSNKGWYFDMVGVLNVEDNSGTPSAVKISGTAITFPDATTQTTAAVAVPSASTTVAGKVELATTAEAIAGTDTSRAVTPEGVLATAFYDVCWDMTANGSFATSTSGTGSSSSASNAFSKQVVGPTSAIGYAQMRWAVNGHTVGASWNSSFNFSKKFDVSLIFARSGGTDSNSEGWFVIGDGGTIVNNGAPNDQSFGIKIVGTNAYGFVHNGTTLSLSSAVSVTSANTLFDVKINSDGAGSVAFNIAGTSFTMTGGPTGLVATNYRNAFTIKVINSAILTGSTNTLLATKFKARIY